MIFNNFSDEFAEQAVAQILMRSRQMEQSIERARAYDYRRLDVPWENAELSGMKIGIAGRDNNALQLAEILKGFNCRLFGYEIDEFLAGYFETEPMFLLDMFDHCDYVFLATSKYGLQIDPSLTLDPVMANRIDSTRLPEPDMRLTDSNVAILGTGNIGSKIARICENGFNCKVTAYSRTHVPNLTRRVKYVPSVEEAISDANYIFVALPLNEGTRNLLGEKELYSFNPKKGPRVLINVTRDEIINSEILFDFLSNGMVMSYGTDVLPKDKILWSGGDPDDTTRKFVQHDSVVATPHEGDCSKRSLERLGVEVLEKINSLVK